MKGEEFKQMRKDLGLTQAQAAVMLGYTRQMIINWEKDKYPVDKSAGLVLKLLTLCNHKKIMIYGDDVLDRVIKDKF